MSMVAPTTNSRRKTVGEGIIAELTDGRELFVLVVPEFYSTRILVEDEGRQIWVDLSQIRDLRTFAEGCWCNAGSVIARVKDWAGGKVTSHVFSAKKKGSKPGNLGKKAKPKPRLNLPIMPVIPSDQTDE